MALRFLVLQQEVGHGGCQFVRTPPARLQCPQGITGCDDLTTLASTFEIPLLPAFQVRFGVTEVFVQILLVDRKSTLSGSDQGQHRQSLVVAGEALSFLG